MPCVTILRDQIFRKVLSKLIHLAFRTPILSNYSFKFFNQGLIQTIYTFEARMD